MAKQRSLAGKPALVLEEDTVNEASGVPEDPSPVDDGIYDFSRVEIFTALPRF